MPQRIRKAWRNYRSMKGVRRELVTLALGIAAGLLVLPPLIYLMGHIFLGDYVRNPSGAPVGGVFSLWYDYVRGLASGSMGYWIALLGPWLLLKWLRISGALLRR